MNDSSIGKPCVGTYLTPEASHINEFVSLLQRNCTESSSNKDHSLAGAHNAMALYTLQMLIFATGHRAVSDPFFDLGTFDTKNSTVLIEDKVVSSAHQARIAWIPPLAICQLEHYVSHLRSLSRFIRQDNSILADQIWAVTEPNYPHPLPLFFFIQEKEGEMDWFRIQPSTIEAMLGEHWILPLNTNRHLLSTWLHRNGCPSEVIDAQLGHIEAGCSPFSARSALDPEGIGRIVIPQLEGYLKEQGWDNVKGLNAPSRLPVSRPPIKSTNLKSSAIFGPQVRSINRAAMWRKDADAVLSLIKDAFPAYPPPSIPDETIDALQDKLINETPDDGRILIRLSLFRRHLIKLRRTGSTVKIPGRLSLANKEEACFDINSSKTAARIEDIRQLFLNYLSSNAGEVADQERRIAEILISSSLFGAQTSPQFLDAIAKGFRNCLYRINDKVIVDASSSATAPVRRWMPDETSRALILGYWKNIDEDSPSPSAEKTNQYLIEILHFINASPPKKKTTDQPASQFLAPLLDHSKAWWRFRLPGVIRAYAEGGISCASVPLSNWLRLITGKSGSLTSSIAAPGTTPCDDIHPIRKLDSSADHHNQAINFWSEINKSLGTPSKKESGSAETRSNARKRAIETRISALLNDNPENMPPIARLIAVWLVHLCRNGTSHKTNLRASSVATYGRTIGERLIALAYDHDFLSLPDLLIEEIYRNVLDTASHENRGYVAARLKEFHTFLIAAYAMPQVDWSEIVDDDLLEAEAVDAGIITISEYKKSLETLLEDPNYIERDRLLHAAVLFFAYRFGLRTGEIFRLTISDIALHERKMVVYVRNSIHGETKSDNGVRQLPLIGFLSESEYGLITRWLEHVSTYADGDHLAALLPKLASQRDVVDRSSCVRTVVEVLRTVTGDTQTRLRHLRHTCATRLFLAMLCEEVPTGPLGSIYKTLWDDVPPQLVRKILIGDSRVSRRGLYAMALFMGHGSPDVTHRHYVHLADLVLEEWVNKNSVSIGDKVLSYAFQTSYANVRKLRSRNKNEASVTSLSEHFTRQSTIPAPKLHNDIQDSSAVSNLTQPSLSRLTPADIDRLLSIATMRDSIDGLADRFLITDQIVASALLSASILQDQTGFTDFSIPQANPDDYWVPNTATRYESLEKESQRARRFLESINQNPHITDQLNIASRFWLDVYHPHSTCLLVNKRSELIQLLEALKSLGIPAKDFEVLIPENRKKGESGMWSSVEEWLLSQGLSVHRQKRLPHGSSRYRSDNRVGLMLRASDAHQLGYQHTLNRALFITSVWLRLCAGSQRT